MTKSHQILGTLALALVLAACGKSEAPAEAPSAEAAPAPMVEEPKPAEGFTTGAPEPELAAEAPAPAVTAPMPAVVQSPNIAGHEDRRLRKAIAEVPAALIGGATSDITAEQAYDRAFKALYHHLAQKKIPTQSFYLKYNDSQGGYWTYMFFGDPTPGAGMYVHVRVFPDGRAEIVD
jgi:hypothetical protein